MENIYAKLLIGFILFVFCSAPYAEPKISVTADNYTFEIPGQWSRASGSDEREIRSTVTKSFIGYANAGNFYVFNAPKNYLVMVYDLKYTGQKPTLEEGMAANEQNFKIGVSRGIVKTILSNNIKTISGRKVLENDWIGKTKKRNNRNLAYIMNTPDKKVNVSVSAFFAENDEAFSSEVKEVLSTFSFTP